MQVLSTVPRHRPPLERLSDAATLILRTGEEEAQQLHLLARVKWPSTRALLRRVGVYRGMHCLDVGCGGGDITLQIARMVVPEGLVVGIDIDAGTLKRARIEAAHERRVRFEALDVADLQDEAAYDLVYSSFLLSQLPDPEGALERMVRAARPSGTVVIEDIDFPAHVCYPPSRAFDRYVELYQAVIGIRGGDAAIGPRLAQLLHKAGVEGLHVEVTQPAFLDGDGKRVAQINMEQMRPAVVGAGLASHAEVNTIIAELNECARDWGTVMSLPRVFQVWGRTTPR